ncbi:MAG: extracellular matrix/biofilm biosynthesis regulator RemA family protein [bacterium]
MHNLLNIGFGNIIVSARIVSVVSAGSSPIKRLRETAKDGNNLIDATEGRKTKTIIVTDSGHIILSALNTATIIARLEESFSVEKNTAI